MPFSLVFFDENYDTDYTFSQEFLRSNLFVNVQKYDKNVKNRHRYNLCDFGKIFLELISGKICFTLEYALCL